MLARCASLTLVFFERDSFNNAFKKLLTSILLFHVVPGEVMSKDVVGLLDAAKDSPVSVKTLQGQHIDITKNEAGDILVNGAKLDLKMVDIEASNGIIHVIDTVIMPETKTVAELVTDAAAAEIGGKHVLA